MNAFFSYVSLYVCLYSVKTILFYKSIANLFETEANVFNKLNKYMKLVIKISSKRLLRNKIDNN